jgi:integrase
MASITKFPDGRKRIQFVDDRGRRRRAVWLGKVGQKVADTIKLRIECIISAREAGAPLDIETARWLAALDGPLRRKFVAVGLCAVRAEGPKPEDSDPRSLGGLLAAFNTARLKIKGSTRMTWKHSQDNLLEFFGAAKDIATITKADAKQWVEWLAVKQDLADTTVRRRTGHAKQFFAFAEDSELIQKSPFAGRELKSTVQPDRSRDYFLSRKDAELILAACPDHEWRLIVALSRYGGLRCPSEHLALRLDEIYWDRDRMKVNSPKTEHHPGGESRIVPIFPELRPYLLEACELAPSGAEFVINRYRSSEHNLRTQMIRIVKRAGIEPWPKIFQNLRATRQTELEHLFPTYVVCAWIGNSPRVARASYLQVTEADFEKVAHLLAHPTPSLAQVAIPSSSSHPVKASGKQGKAEKSRAI